MIKIETPKYSFIKRKDDGSIDYISPVPCPFNYGSVLDTVSGDGDRLDAIVLGPKLKFGQEVDYPVVGVVEFMDKGEPDPKFIYSKNPITRIEKLKISSFFFVFSMAKKALNKARGKEGLTKVLSFEIK